MKKTRIQIFQGTTRKQTRDYLQAVFTKLRASYERVIVPCAGRFTIPSVARGSGFSTDEVIVSDISLFSTVIGRYINDHQISDLGIKYHKNLEYLHENDGKELHHASALYAMKIGQFHQSDNYYNQTFREELERVPEAYIKRFNEQLIEMRQTIGAIKYRIADLWTELEEYKQDQKAIIYMNPPAYKSGYAKMFDYKGFITWDEPSIPEFDATTGMDDLFDYAIEAKSLVLWYRRKKVKDREKTYMTFGHQTRPDQIDFNLCNRPEEIPKSIQQMKVIDVKPLKTHVLPYNHNITTESEIKVACVTQDVALYYRDLFAHKLPIGYSETYFCLLLDGYVFGAVGMHLAAARRRNYRNGSFWLHETFGFTAPTKYYRLTRLLMMCITTTRFVDDIIKTNPGLAYIKPVKLQTTCIADVPELKTNRGILKLVDRRKLPNGKYHINYNTDFRDETYKEALQKWLSKHGKVMTP